MFFTPDKTGGDKKTRLENLESLLELYFLLDSLEVGFFVINSFKQKITIPKFLASSFLSPPNFSRWFLTGLKNTSKCVSTENVKEKIRKNYSNIKTQSWKERTLVEKGRTGGVPLGGALEWRVLEWGSRKTALGQYRKKGILYAVREIGACAKSKRALGRGRTKWALGEVEQREPLDEVGRRGHLIR